MTIYDMHHESDWWDHDRQKFSSSRKTSLPLGHGAPHHPNKNEAKALRRIMAQTGLTKEQVRDNPKYRKMLSQEQDRGENVDMARRHEKWKRDEATRQIMEGHARKAQEAAEIAAKAFKKYQKTPEYLIELLSKDYSANQR